MGLPQRDWQPCQATRELAYDVAFFARFDAVVWATQLMLDEDRAVYAAMLKALTGTDKAFVFTSGTSLLSDSTGATGARKSSA